MGCIRVQGKERKSIWPCRFYNPRRSSVLLRVQHFQDGRAFSIRRAIKA